MGGGRPWSRTTCSGRLTLYTGVVTIHKRTYDSGVNVNSDMPTQDGLITRLTALRKKSRRSGGKARVSATVRCDTRAQLL